jgi:hypothetical protein
MVASFQAKSRPSPALGLVHVVRGDKQRHPLGGEVKEQVRAGIRSFTTWRRTSVKPRSSRNDTSMARWGTVV